MTPNHAFRDADLVTDAVVDGLGGARSLREALADYQRRRDDDTAAMFEFTVELASFKDPAPKERVLFEALEDKPEEISRFLAVIAGAEPMSSYFAPGHLVKLWACAAWPGRCWGVEAPRAAPREGSRVAPDFRGHPHVPSLT